jgi:GTP-binding protein LepA
MQHLDEVRVVITFEMPLSAVITEMHDRLKSISAGYASMSSEFLEFRAEDLVKLDILIAGDRVDSLSQMVHRSEARFVGMPIVKKLKEVIPRANFPIALQSAIGGKIIARETIPAFRKDVTAGLYGGDVSRKNKLLKKQKAGKKRMKAMGKIELPQEAFLAVLKREE